MCTVTLVSDGEKVRLACNRDESVTRAAALGPRVARFGLRRALLPVDPSSGGTWIAVNDAGLALAILNVNPSWPREPKRVPERSRGTIIPELLHCATQASAVAMASDLNADWYAPFRLLLANRRTLTEVCCDGRSIWIVRRTSIQEPLLFTSSGLGDSLVEEPRRQLFSEVLGQGVDRFRQQEWFHRHSWPDRRDVSVCMSRAAARTVSHTVVCLAPDEVTITHHPDAPDQVAADSIHRLPLVHYAERITA